MDSFQSIYLTSRDFRHVAPSLPQYGAYMVRGSNGWFAYLHLFSLRSTRVPPAFPPIMTLTTRRNSKIQVMFTFPIHSLLKPVKRLLFQGRVQLFRLGFATKVELGCTKCQDRGASGGIDPPKTLDPACAFSCDNLCRCSYLTEHYRLKSDRAGKRRWSRAQKAIPRKLAGDWEITSHLIDHLGFPT